MKEILNNIFNATDSKYLAKREELYIKAYRQGLSLEEEADKNGSYNSDSHLAAQFDIRHKTIEELYRFQLLSDIEGIKNANIELSKEVSYEIAERAVESIKYEMKKLEDIIMNLATKILGPDANIDKLPIRDVKSKMISEARKEIEVIRKTGNA